MEAYLRSLMQPKMVSFLDREIVTLYEAVLCTVCEMHQWLPAAEDRYPLQAQMMHIWNSLI